MLFIYRPRRFIKQRLSDGLLQYITTKTCLFWFFHITQYSCECVCTLTCTYHLRFVNEAAYISFNITALI